MNPKRGVKEEPPAVAKGKEKPGKNKKWEQGRRTSPETSFLHLASARLLERPRFTCCQAQLSFSTPTVPPPHTEEQGWGDAPPSSAVPSPSRPGAPGLTS